MKREKTQYPGVYYRLQNKPGSTAQEKVFYIFYRQEGKQIEERVGRESGGMTAARANQVRALRMSGKELSNQARREAAEAAKQADEERPTIDRLWILYDEMNAGRSSRAEDDNRYNLHLKSSFSMKTPAELVTLDVDRLRISKLKTHSPQTVKHILSLLRRIINYGVRQGRCPQPDPSRLRFEFPRIDNIKTENLTTEQMVAYLVALDEEADQNAASLLRLALATGMRKGALLDLQWSDIDFERKFIRLRADAAKNERTEKIPMSAAAEAILERVAHTSTYIFPGRHGEKRKEFSRIARRVRDKAGLPKDFRPLHALRHTFASWAASSGKIDLYTLQKLLTHGSSQMTQRYAHLADASLQRAAAVTADLFSDVAGGNPETAKVLPFPKAQAE